MITNLQIAQIVLSAANIIGVIWMYRDKSYKVAIFNGFAAGFSIADLIHELFLIY
jgi:hypothetical protein